jgi:hypothetical protein
MGGHHKIIIMVVVLGLLMTAINVAAQDSVLVSYQGRLTDDAGNPVPNSTYQITFSLFNGPDLVDAAWAETHPAVQTDNGLFTVILGSVNRLEETVFENEPLYLEIKIGESEIISPRTLLTSVPSAAFAKKVIGDIETGEGGLVINDDLGDSVIVLSSGVAGAGARSIGGSIKMFNPQPEPPALMFEINSDAVAGASMNIYDEIGQVMGVEPSPFNDGYSIKLMDPTDDGGRREVHLTASATEGAGIYLMDPTDDGRIVSLTSSPSNGGSIKMFNPQPEPPAILFDLSANVSRSSDDIEMSLTDGDSTYQTKLTPGRVKVGHPTYDSYPRSELNAGADSITFFMQGLSAGAPAPSIAMLSSSTEAKIGIGTMTAGEPLVVGKDLGSWAGDRIVVGDDTPGEYTGLVMGEDHTTRAHLTWNIDDNFLGMGIEEGGTHYRNILVLRDGMVGINTTSPSTDLHVNGDICYTGSIGACSDIRYKRNVHTLEHALDKISCLRGVSFEWKRDEYPGSKFGDDEQIGLIAQEVKEIVPQIVNETGDGYYNVDYSKLTALLVEAVKELKKENELLKARLEKIEKGL